MTREQVIALERKWRLAVERESDRSMSKRSYTIAQQEAAQNRIRTAKNRYDKALCELHGKPYVADFYAIMNRNVKA